MSDTILFIGANPVVSHPILWGRVRQNTMEGRKVIVIDPRRSETAMNADYWYGLKWRSDLLLLYTVANELIERDWVDHGFIEAHTEQFEEFRRFVKSYTLERGAAGTGLSREEILELVRLIHEGKRVSFWWTMGVNQGYHPDSGRQFFSKLFSIIQDVFRIHHFTFFHHRANHISLPACRHLFFYKAVSPVPVAGIYHTIFDREISVGISSKNIKDNS